jgi:hypothetical protein
MTDATEVFAAIAKAPRELVKALEDLVFLPATVHDRYRDRGRIEWLRGFNSFLGEIRFTPGGIRDAIANFCDNPTFDKWLIVRSKCNAGQALLIKLNDKMKVGIEKDIFAGHPDIRRVVETFAYRKQGGIAGTIGDKLKMPETREEIRRLRGIVSLFDEANKELEQLQDRIAAYLREADGSDGDHIRK